MTFAHIAGLPVEESFATAAPVLGILAVVLGAWLRGLTASLRRRKSEKPTR
jgi:uncharacterized membrane protein